MHSHKQICLVIEILIKRTGKTAFPNPVLLEITKTDKILNPGNFSQDEWSFVICASLRNKHTIVIDLKKI